MRASLFSAAVATALTFTAWTPGDAQAQIRVFPTISGSPYTSYGYSYPMAAGWYNYPSYYNYNWTTPYSSWSSSWYNAPGYYGYPRYGSYYGYGNRYRGGLGYRGWRRW